HHGPRRLGGSEAAFSRTGRDRADRSVYRRRHRGHGRRRFWQRDVVIVEDQAGCRIQPPAHLYGSRAGYGGELSRAATAVRAAPLELGGLQREAYFEGRWCLVQASQADKAQQGGKAPARHRKDNYAAARTDSQRTEGASRPSVERRHWNVCKGEQRKPCGGG